jgi:hypothetical protein
VRYGGLRFEVRGSWCVKRCAGAAQQRLGLGVKYDQTIFVPGCVGYFGLEFYVGSFAGGVGYCCKYAVQSMRLPILYEYCEDSFAAGG